MKRILMNTLMFGTFLGAFAQTPKTRYRLPNGDIVAHDKLDSVGKAWGGRGFLMQHDEVHPDLISISPMTNAYLKQMAAQKADLGKLLDKQAPDFALTDITGKKWKLSALKGNTVVLNFWFTTCPPCMQEMPALNELKKKYAGQKVVFLALALDDAKVIGRFLPAHPFAYTLFPGAGTVSDSYHVSNYPTHIVIDPKGIVRFQQVGGSNIEQAIIGAITQASNRS